MLLDLICCKVVLVCWEACWTECQIVTLTHAPVVGQQISGLKLIARLLMLLLLAIYNCWVGWVLCSLAAQPTNPMGVTNILDISHTCS